MPAYALPAAYGNELNLHNLRQVPPGKCLPPHNCQRVHSGVAVEQRVKTEGGECWGEGDEEIWEGE